MNESIYGNYRETMEKIMQDFVEKLSEYNRQVYEQTGEKLFEHLNSRIKAEDSVREKCRRKGLPENAHSALWELKDAIGVRIVFSFMDDIFKSIEYIKTLENCTVITEKNYIRHAKPNGYRSYHMILAFDVPYEDVCGRTPGRYYIEVQLRTIAMDSWASLEHQLKYKKDVLNQSLIVAELKRCADELASCDVSMQTIRNLIRKPSPEG